MEKMKLLKKRDFGTVLNDSLQFTFQNFGRYSKAFLYIVMPPIVLMIVGIFFLYMSLSHHSTGAATLANGLKPAILIAMLPLMLAAFVLLVIVSLVHTSLSYQYMLLYESKEDPSQITVEELWTKIKSDLMQLFGAYVGLIALITVCIAITAGITYVLYAASGSSLLSGLFILIMFFVWAYLSIVLSNYFMIILREKAGVSDALHRCFILIKGHWWPTFGVMAVIGILAYIIQTICLLPLTIVYAVTAMHSVFSSGLNAKAPMGGTMYAIIQALSWAVSFYISVFFSFAAGINYYSLVENTDHTSLLEEIGQIGEKPDPDPKQEGSY
jgi:hypothetical protein